jgi:hypothetical protein
MLYYDLQPETVAVVAQLSVPDVRALTALVTAPDSQSGKNRGDGRGHHERVRCAIGRRTLPAWDDQTVVGDGHGEFGNGAPKLAIDGVLAASDVAATPAEPTGDALAEVANG